MGAEGAGQGEEAMREPEEVRIPYDLAIRIVDELTMTLVRSRDYEAREGRRKLIIALKRSIRDAEREAVLGDRVL